MGLLLFDVLLDVSIKGFNSVVYHFFLTKWHLERVVNQLGILYQLGTDFGDRMMQVWPMVFQIEPVVNCITYSGEKILGEVLVVPPTFA